MMLEPPNRSSLWRSDPSAPPNYNDNQNYCGGANFQWSSMGGKCGVCGDPYNAPHPQDNENTGKYGQGKVVQQYTPGSLVDVQILLTTNHIGFFNFSLCVLQDPNVPESGEDCFQALALGNGESKYDVKFSEKSINTQEITGDSVTTGRIKKDVDLKKLSVRVQILQ
ncbi:Chitin bind 3 domain containing protein [Asbolus verrucosus]|uniref:Chitin bind 3 domain containing protein n=1 Tax=Asbolus verrucosus TaxID=1661398 RepID=A0A482VNE7_ASBVE|nr:Chitin bind 3 domain containing protein [Asbolus verrucosus]